jgi:hypothetical protein
MAQQVASEISKDSWFRSVVNRRHESNGVEKQLRVRKHTLDTCSKYDHEASWKRTRKLGNSTIYRQSNEYLSWKNEQASSTLLCFGKLGSGKSVLLANVVDDLTLNANATARIAYFFCQHDAFESTKAQTVIGSLSRQLLQPIRDLTRASEFFVEHQERSVENLCGLLKVVLNREYQAYIVLDGLESCNECERTAILDALRSFQDVCHCAFPSGWKLRTT